MISRSFSSAGLRALLCLCTVAGPLAGSAQQFTQYYSVDCSNPSAQYPTISSALAVATDGASIYVPSGTTCNENVTVGYLKNVAIVTDWMKTFNLNGNLTIQSSHTVEIQGMNVTNASGDGIDVNNSTDVTLTFVSSANNQGEGLATSTSDVSIAGAGTFSNNGSIGINASTNSTLSIVAWGGIVDISNNMGRGINADRSVVWGLGNTTINNNQAVPGSGFPNGFAISELGGAKAGIFGFLGPTIISSNAGGGVALEETSQISLGGSATGAPYAVKVEDNGAVGVIAEYGSQLTLFGGVRVTGHSLAGVSLYGNSQAAIYSDNQIVRNATGTGRGRAGIVVDNGSQAYVSTATIQDNGGPGILGMVHATLDVEDSTFTSNTGGAVVCDPSTVLETDLPHAVLGSANACEISPLGNHMEHSATHLIPSLPDWRSIKARSIRLSKMRLAHPLGALPLSK